jgi:hypothetical protein
MPDSTSQRPFHDLDKFINTLERLPAEKKNGIFVHILLLKHLHYLQAMQNTVLQDTVLSALVTRQLLELLITAEYVRSSEERALEFLNSYYKDALDVDESLLRLGTALAKRGPITVNRDEIARRIQDKKDHIAGKHRPPKVFSISRAANMVDLSDDYAAVNKLCSKFLHCTPISILHSDDNEYLRDDDDLRQLFIIASDDYAHRISKCVTTSIKAGLSL